MNVDVDELDAARHTNNLVEDLELTFDAREDILLVHL